MFHFLASIVRFVQPTAVLTPPSPAALLMESADVRAGGDAQYARELRAAASAWLSVVR